MEWNYDWYDSKAHLNSKIFNVNPYNLIKKEKLLEAQVMQLIALIVVLQKATQEIPNTMP